MGPAPRRLRRSVPVGGTHRLTPDRAGPIASLLSCQGGDGVTPGVETWAMQRIARERRLAMIGERQAQVFSRDQALSAGYTRSSIQRMLDAGRWQRPLPGVYLPAGAPLGRTQRLWVAVLAAGHGAVLTHESAARLHGAERLPEQPVTMTVPHGWHQRLPGVMAHQIDDLLPHHRTRLDGLPVSTAARAVVELGATQPIRMVGRVADDLVNARRTTFVAISAVLNDVARPGKPGLVRVARVLEERGPGYVPPQSELERALLSALEAGGLPEPVRQLPLPGRGARRGVVDAAYPDAKIVLEADGRRWHTRVDDLRRDRERDARAVKAGWVPLRFVYEQIVHQPRDVCSTVAETLAVRLRPTIGPRQWVPPLAG
jgi:very-short-patch-repair endonuclease